MNLKRERTFIHDYMTCTNGTLYLTSNFDTQTIRKMNTCNSLVLFDRFSSYFTTFYLDTISDRNLEKMNKWVIVRRLAQIDIAGIWIPETPLKSRYRVLRGWFGWSWPKQRQYMYKNNCIKEINKTNLM